MIQGPKALKCHPSSTGSFRWFNQIPILDIPPVYWKQSTTCTLLQLSVLSWKSGSIKGHSSENRKLHQYSAAPCVASLVFQVWKRSGIILIEFNSLTQRSQKSESVCFHSKPDFELVSIIASKNWTIQHLPETSVFPISRCRYQSQRIFEENSIIKHILSVNRLKIYYMPFGFNFDY